EMSFHDGLCDKTAALRTRFREPAAIWPLRPTERCLRRDVFGCTGRTGPAPSSQGAPMKIATFAFGGAGALAGLRGTTSAFAFTHHPATPAEIQQTDALNAQSLANARGAQPAAADTTANGTATTPAGAVTTDTTTNTDLNGSSVHSNGG